MDLEFAPEYDQFREEVRTFIAENRHLIISEGGGFGVKKYSSESIEWQARLIKHGYTARTIPKEYGGYGAEPDILKALIIGEEFSRAGAPGGFADQGVAMLVPTLLELGTEEQKQKWINDTIHGRVIWCQGYSEPGAGSDLAALRTSAVEDGDDFIINGQKIWTSVAAIADMMFILVRTEPDAPKHKGISYLLLPMDTPGVEVRPLKSMTGSAEFNEVFFTDVRLKKDQIVGRRGEGWQVANATLTHERGSIGDPASVERMANKLADLMLENTNNGAALMESPVHRDRLLQLQARAKALRYHTLRLLTCGLTGESPGAAKLIAKYYGTELNFDLSNLATDILGENCLLDRGTEYTRSKGFWQLTYLFSTGMIIAGGTAQIQKNIIAERGLGMPREPKVTDGNKIADSSAKGAA